jgi:hypothetical protein
MARKSASALRVAPAPEPRPPSRLDLPDGGTAELRGEALEVRDREGRLLVRYADGAAEISAPSGDLRLSAPQGRVVLSGALDVAIEAGRDVTHKAGRRIDLSTTAAEEPQVRIDGACTELKSDRLHVQAKSSRAVIGQAALVAHAIVTTADRIAVTAGTCELLADRLVERSRDAFREVTDLAQSKLGRVRTLVEGVYSLSSRRTVMVSSDDTTIDGSHISLG